MLESKYLQKHVRNRPANKYGLGKTKQTIKAKTEETSYTFSLMEWATMPYLGEAPLLDGGSYGSMENGGEGVWVAWETKGLKASTRAA